MRRQRINRVSRKVLIVLSLAALLAVLSGYTQSPQPDEGVTAHIFRLSIAAVVLMILLFLATADWRQPCEACNHYCFQAALWFLRLERWTTLNTTGKLRHNQRFNLTGHPARRILGAAEKKYSV